MIWWISALLSREHLGWKLCLAYVVNFPTCMQPWLETLIGQFKSLFFLSTATSSFHELTGLPADSSALCRRVRPSVCLSADLVGHRKVDLLHAGCGNHNVRAKRKKNAHAAETAIKYSATPCPKKAMKKHAECMIWPLRVCLLSFPLSAFLNPSVILFFLLSSHGEHLSWRREDPRQVTCKRGQNQHAQCHAFSISFEVPLTLPIIWAHLIQLPP